MMTKDNLLEELLDNNETFYLMIRSVAMLGSENSELLDRDAQMLIGFIGAVFSWKRELVEAAIDLILGDMMRIALIADYHALASIEMLDKTTAEHLVLYELKGRAIEEVYCIETENYSFTEQQIVKEARNQMCYHSFHHIYDPRVKYSEIKKKADQGEMLCTLQEAFMLILGIGCNIDIPLAQHLLERLLIWGEKNAAAILAFLWEQEQDQDMALYYRHVIDKLNRRVAFPDHLFGKFSGNDPSSELCYIIAAIQSIIKSSGKREIDILFADTLIQENLSFIEKIALIRQYEDSEWLNYCFTRGKPGFLH